VLAAGGTEGGIFLIEFLQSIDLPVWLWLIALVIFGVVEAATAGLVCIWFAMGAMAALLAALVGTGVVEQVVVFAVVSAATLAATRPLVRRMTAGKAVATNADRVLGAAAKVTETIDNENSAGAVYVDGKTWTARSADGSVIPAGEQVEVISMEGVKLFVKLCEKTEGAKV
jgi:membrane protein implicated in regulation of membrane protease activity